MRVAWSSDHGQDLDFWYFWGHDVDSFDFSRRSVYVLVRSLRSLRVGGVARFLRKFWCFSDSGIFSAFVYFGVIMVICGFLT